MTDNNDGAVAEIRNKFGDPESFAERELVVTGNIQSLPVGTILYPASKVEELRAEVARLTEQLRYASEASCHETTRADAAERRVEQLLAVVRYAIGNPEFNSAQFTEMCKHALTGAGAK